MNLKAEIEKALDGFASELYDKITDILKLEVEARDFDVFEAWLKGLYRDRLLKLFRDKGYEIVGSDSPMTDDEYQTDEVKAYTRFDRQLKHKLRTKITEATK